MEIFDSWDSPKLPSLRPYPKSELFAIQWRMADHLGYNQLNPTYYNTRPVLEKWIKSHWAEWHESRKPQKQLDLFEVKDYELSPLEKQLNALRKRGINIIKPPTLVQWDDIHGRRHSRLTAIEVESPFTHGQRVRQGCIEGIYLGIDQQRNQAVVKSIRTGVVYYCDPLSLFPVSDNDRVNQLRLEL
ncbi:hypothetical protein NEA10_20745 (plasmid) [Phormidium yuhuli AB48]|uniref:Transposase n=1 Tax=Phormidium yuhuli AB48 TaxID=2940671 RepID=A0ABY5AW55_9CYAN|nr:hypothetical protein [Phormidium yuhuli]USR93275.1 hypothetical protein NEA10_20745 [Phormidium yuhuli AB48]